MKKTTLLILMLLSVFVLSSNAQTYILNEDFSAVTTGNNTSTSGSSTAFTATANFPTVSTVYQAGGALKFGSGSAVGSITSKSLDLSVNGGVFSVSFDVKGWTTVEGDIKVTVTGQTAQTVTYTAVLASTSFETKTLSFTGGTTNSTVKIETTAKRAFIDNVKVYYSAPTCTSSNLAFAQPTINKLLADGAFTQAATSLNGTTAITYTSSNTGAATVNETTGEISIVGAGSTIITASQAAGTQNAVDYCAAITTYTVNVAAAAPTITVTEISVPDMAAYVGESDTETMNVSGINLTEGIALAISGANANQFALSTNSVSQTGGAAANTVVSIYYNPTTTGTHTATLTISSAGATTVTRTLTGSASWAPLAVPVATDATGITNTSFIANWNTVAGATEYQLDVTAPGAGSAATITEGFGAGVTAPTDWTFTNIGAGSTYTSNTNFGASSPSLKLDASGDVVLTPMLPSPATALSFWMKGQTSTNSTFLVEGLVDGTTWTTIQSFVTPSSTGATYTYNASSTPALPANVKQFRFTYTKVTSNLAFDDVSYSYTGISEQPIAGSPFTVTGDNSKSLTGDNSKSLTGLTAGATYKYTVIAKNANVTSAVSNQISVTTTTGTGLGQLKDELKVYTRNGNVLLTTKAGNTIEIYNAVGQKLATHISVDGLNTIAVSYKGVALVKVGNHVAKVIL